MDIVQPQPYDLLLRGGRVIDPAQGLDGLLDVAVRAARDNADLVRGVKGHAEIGGFTRWGDAAMRRAAEIGRALDLPLYIHFGQLWPLPDDKHPFDADAILPDMIEILRPGDILA